ncbi:MAG: hypothetical protein ACTHMF_17410 [Leifsonia sp.]
MHFATALLRERYDAVMVQSWFKGRNPSLVAWHPRRCCAKASQK